MRAALALGLLSMASLGARAAESYDGCTNFVTALPATITTPGTWCLTHDLTSAATFNVLEIAADDVVLDCNGFRIDGSPRAPGEYAVGIAAINRVRITVRRCQVRNFSEGIIVFAPGSTPGHHLIEDNRVDRNTTEGIYVIGDGSVIRRNRVLETNNEALQQPANGILASGTMVIEDNLVSGVRSHSANTAGIRSHYNYGGRIRGNLVRGVVRTGTGDLVFGIYVVSASVGSTIRDNTVVGDGTPNTIGVLCDSTKVVLKDNLVRAFATNNYGCRDAGNVLKP